MAHFLSVSSPGKQLAHTSPQHLPVAYLYGHRANIATLKHRLLRQTRARLLLGWPTVTEKQIRDKVVGCTLTGGFLVTAKSVTHASLKS